MSGRGESTRRATLLAGFAFLYIPIAWIVFFSFRGGEANGGGFRLSLEWYRALAGNNAYLDAALRSLELAVISAAISTVLGTLAGIGLARIREFPGRGLLMALLAVPIFAPEILLGFSFLMLFAAFESLTGWAQGKGMLTLVIAHATLGTSIVASVVLARVLGRDQALENAARDLGARPLRVLCTVTIPLAAPGIASGALLALTLSFDDVVTSSFLAGPENTTLPMAIFSSLHVGINSQINALGTLMLLGVAVMVGLASFAMRVGRRDRRSRESSQVDARPGTTANFLRDS